MKATAVNGYPTCMIHRGSRKLKSQSVNDNIT